MLLFAFLLGPPFCSKVSVAVPFGASCRFSIRVDFASQWRMFMLGQESRCRTRGVAKSDFRIPTLHGVHIFRARHAAWRFEFQFLRHLSCNIAIFNAMVGGARADTRVNGWAFRFEFARPRIASRSDCDGSWAGGVYLPLVVRGSAADVG